MRVMNKRGLGKIQAYAHDFPLGRPSWQRPEDLGGKIGNNPSSALAEQGFPWVQLRVDRSFLGL